MTPKLFAKKTTADKWQWICEEMRQIQAMETTFSLRRRYNPHHPKNVVDQETKDVRLSQYTKWCNIKDLYAEFRDELADTLSHPEYSHCKSILERIFTKEVDDQLRQLIDE